MRARHLLVWAIVSFGVPELAQSATTLDLTSGTTGALSGLQSFNETRGVEVTVMSASDQLLLSMTLNGLSISPNPATVGARVYESSSEALIASAETTVLPGNNLSVTLPVSATLAAGSDYRLSFFVDAGGSGGSGTMFDPDPSGTGGFPYTDATETLAINQAYSIASDAFPTNPNTYVPLITLDVTPPTPVGPITVTFSGVITFLSDPGGVVDPSIGIGDVFTGSYTLDPDAAVLSGADSGASIYELVGAGNAASVLLEGFSFENTTGSMGPFLLGINASIGTGPAIDIVYDAPYSSDAWEVFLLSNAGAIALPLPGPGPTPAHAQNCGLGFNDPTGTRLDSGDFFVNTSSAGWNNGGYFGCGDVGDIPNLLFYGPITSLNVVLPTPAPVTSNWGVAFLSVFLLGAGLRGLALKRRTLRV